MGKTTKNIENRWIYSTLWKINIETQKLEVLDGSDEFPWAKLNELVGEPVSLDLFQGFLITSLVSPARYRSCPLFQRCSPGFIQKLMTVGGKSAWNGMLAKSFCEIFWDISQRQEMWSNFGWRCRHTDSKKMFRVFFWFQMIHGTQTWFHLQVSKKNKA